MPCGCSQIAKGAAGLAKATLGIDRADDATIETRRNLCRACPEAVPCIKNTAKFCMCNKCGCLLKAKTVIASEKCPLGKW